MKTTAKNAIREESGKILILVLVLLVVGGLLLTPLLGLMSTGLASGQVYEKKAAELYAADAGVEDAIWRIRTKSIVFTNNHTSPDSLTVNDKTVAVDVWQHKIEGTPACHKEYRYQIRSTAIGLDGSGTTVEAVLKSFDLDYSGFVGNAITSGADVTIRPRGTVLGEVCGDILLPPGGVLDPPNYQPECGGEVKRGTLIWPTARELSDWYWMDVDNAISYSQSTLDAKDYLGTGAGPLSRNGTLDIQSTGGAGLTLELNGTIYVTGDTTIGTTNHAFTLDLRGNTIFIESSSTGNGNEALKVGGKVSIKGPGAIIAIGDIYFGPEAQVGDAPVMVLSVSNSVRLQPLGNFYGSINGQGGVSVQPNNRIHYPDGGLGELNFPGLIEGKERYTIQSWVIS